MSYYSSASQYGLGLDLPLSYRLALHSTPAPLSYRSPYESRYDESYPYAISPYNARPLYDDYPQRPYGNPGCACCCGHRAAPSFSPPQLGYGSSAYAPLLY